VKKGSAMFDHDLMNIRHAKAMSFTSILMEEIGDILPYEIQRQAYDRIFDVMYKNGASWTTDQERERFGFEPRDDAGWTSSERVKRKIKELELLNSQVIIMGKL